MSSILDINSGSSDSEDDQDYVPPTTAISDESEDEISEEENKSSGAPTPKKMKLDVKTKGPSVGKSTESIWKEFLQGVEVDSSYNDGKKKAIASGLNLSHQNSSDSSDLSISQDKTNDSDKSTWEMTIPEKEIISENPLNKDETVLSDDLCKEKKTVSESEIIVPIEKSISAGKSNSTKVKPVAAVEINTARAGLTSVLGAIANKEKKMTVLQKSQLDWKNYKKEEGIEENLATYNRGRHGYIERKRFLERSDLRLFESEKSARLGGRKK